MSGNYTLYMHTCPNGKRYVGITERDPSKRWSNGSGYRTQLFGRAVDKYGWNNICHEVLLVGLSKEEAEERERFYIALFRTQSQKFGYNLDSGGNLGNTHSEETRNRLSEVARLRWENEAYRNRIRESLRETHHTEGFRQRLREANLGKKMPADAKEKISATLKGRVSPMRGRHHSDASKLRTSVALKGRATSDATKEKLRVAAVTDRGRAVLNLDTGEVYDSIASAAKRNGLSHQNINACVLGKRKTCGGYHWAYCERDDSNGKV